MTLPHAVSPRVDPTVRRTRIQFAALALVSLVLLTGTDRGVLLVARSATPALLWFPLARIPSFLVCLALWAVCVRTSPWVRPGPSTPWPRVRGVIAGLWLAAGLSPVVGAYVPTLPGAALAGFLVFGLVAEELLFRGVIFTYAQRAFPTWRAGPAWLSALLFATSHFGYHGWHVTPAAVQQVAYTFALGLGLGALRAWTGSFLPGAAAHLGVNGIGLVSAALIGWR